MDREANSSVITELDCISSVVSRNIFITWFTAYLLLLPVFLLVLYICFNKWKQPQSSGSGGLSHSDVFTLNVVAMEMISVTGSCVILSAYLSSKSELLTIGSYTAGTTTPGQMLFHTLTCVERYLAVVHPVTYLRLRGEGGVTVRNISVALVWVFSGVYSLPLPIMNDPVVFAILSFVVSVAPLPLVSYCSVYVLCVLTRPKPGAVGGQRKQVSQSKRSTVYTMVAILAALLLRFTTYSVGSSVIVLFWHKIDICVTSAASVWASLPSSLVLPLLLLHRAGKVSKARK